MFKRGIIDKCMSCGKYHVNEDKPKWPISNISKCKKCRLRKEMAHDVIKGWLHESIK